MLKGILQVRKTYTQPSWPCRESRKRDTESTSKHQLASLWLLKADASGLRDLLGAALL